MRVLRWSVRPALGRGSPIWRVLRSPRLRFAAFSDAVDCVVYSLLISLPRVRFVQIGANDGKTGDPLWSFRGYPNWAGVLVEPFGSVYAQLERNYATWPDRFTPVNAAIADESGMRPFYHLAGNDPGSDHHDQLGSVDEALVTRHARHLSPPEGLSVIVSQVRCLTFTELCDGHGIERLDLICIDAEGSDGAIIEQIDFGRYEPAVVLYEHMHLSDNSRTAALRRMTENGYETLALGSDTLAVRHGALASVPALKLAWRIVRTRANAHRGSRSG